MKKYYETVSKIILWKSMNMASVYCLLEAGRGGEVSVNNSAITEVAFISLDLASSY